MESPTKTREMLEVIFGGTFRQRHSELESKINSAFEGYTPQTSVNYPVTMVCLLARLAYSLAPLCKIGPKSNRALPKILPRPAKKQQNNLADEKYVASGLICDRVITCDRGMKNMLELFRAADLWRGQDILFLRDHDLMGQMSLLL
jgi:hypothetical protein